MPASTTEIQFKGKENLLMMSCHMGTNSIPIIQVIQVAVSLAFSLSFSVSLPYYRLLSVNNKTKITILNSSVSNSPLLIEICSKFPL